MGVAIRGVVMRRRGLLLQALENELDVFNIMVCRKQAKRRKVVIN